MPVSVTIKIMENRNSICTWSLEGYDFKSDDELIDFCAKNGFAHLDVSLDIYDRYFDWWHADEEECKAYATNVQARAAAKGVYFTQTHLPYDLTFVYRLDNVPTEKRLSNAYFKDPLFLQMHEKATRFSSYLGAKFAVVHPLCLPYQEENYEIEKQINIQYFTRLNEVAKAYKVKLALENIFDWKEGCIRTIYPSKATGLKDYVDSLNSENIVVCIDTGHSHVAHESVGDAIRILGDKVQVLHMHDNDAKLDQHIFLGMGTIDWAACREALRAIGYSGTYSLEIKPFPYYVSCEHYTKFLRDMLLPFYGEQ